jgi:hypothetical protein
VCERICGWVDEGEKEHAVRERACSKRKRMQQEKEV